MEQLALAVVARDERAASLLADQDVLGDELVDGLAHGPDADPVALGESALGGDCLAGLPFAVRERVGETVLDVLVERHVERRLAGVRVVHRRPLRSGRRAFAAMRAHFPRTLAAAQKLCK